MEVHLLTRKLLYEQVVEELVQRIKNGIYKPKDRLPTEKELVEELGVSRNSLREAMKCLAAAGVVTSTSGKGTFVSPNAPDLLTKSGLMVDLSVYESVTEIIEFRYMIEPESAYLAARKATAEQIDELHDILMSLRDRVSKGEHWERTGLQFHNMIARMTGNGILVSIMDSISQELYKSREFIYERTILQDTDWEEHKAIYEAVRRRNAEEARECMKRHLKSIISQVKIDREKTNR
jgi:GntR family transcriptional repressor for pyruvate dehydrogenase complex